MDEKSLQRISLDKKTSSLSSGKDLLPSGSSWINIIRTALGMTSTQLAERLNISQPRISALEKNENNLKISTLQKVAEALNCDFVYYFKPKESLQKIVEDKATVKAKGIVNSVNQNMTLEDQYVEDTDESICDLRDELIRNNIKIIWD